MSELLQRGTVRRDPVPGDAVTSLAPMASPGSGADPRLRLTVTGLSLVVPGAAPGTERVLVRDLSFRVNPGEFWCVLGRNGCGKSTLLRTLAGLQPPADGVMLFGDLPLTQWDWRNLARRRALLPQQSVDAFSSSVLETVLIARSPHRAHGWSFGSAADADHVLARAALADFSVAHLASRDVRTLSGGERQRVALAALLAQTPHLALLDEPTAHLDLDAAEQVLRLLAARVAAQSTPSSAMLALHDVNQAERHATHVLLFLEGGTVLAGPKAEVLDAERLSLAFRHPVRRLSDPATGAGWFVAE